MSKFNWNWIYIYIFKYLLFMFKIILMCLRLCLFVMYMWCILVNYILLFFFFNWIEEYLNKGLCRFIIEFNMYILICIVIFEFMYIFLNFGIIRM